MAAYFVAQYVVKDPKLYREYQIAGGPTMQAHGGELVSFDVAAETIEGTPPGPVTVVRRAIHDRVLPDDRRRGARSHRSASA
jgi:uncharacterized protein (DUF1330 family)